MVLRVALPERGASAARARELVEKAGFTLRAGPSEAAQSSVRFYGLPERDIAVYTTHGGLHLALTGSLALAEASVNARTVVELDSTSHELVLLAPRDGAPAPADLAGRRVATPYPHLVRRYFAVRGIGVDKVIALDPAEHGVALGIADAVAVVVPVPRDDSGSLGGLRPIDVVESCRLVAVEGRETVEETVRAASHRFLGRLRAARLADSVHLVQFDCPEPAIEAALADVPSLREPEVSSSQQGWSIVRLLVAAGESGDAILRLRARGCREILAFRPRMYEPGPERVDPAATAGRKNGPGVPPEEIVGVLPGQRTGAYRRDVRP